MGFGYESDSPLYRAKWRVTSATGQERFSRMTEAVTVCCHGSFSSLASINPSSSPDASLLIEEGDGDLTRYEFTNLKINAPVSQSRFSLNLPPNTRVEAMKLQ